MRFKPYLDDQLVSFNALTLLVRSSGMIWPVKIIAKMTYNVLSGTLSLCTTIYYTILLLVIWEIFGAKRVIYSQLQSFSDGLHRPT